MVLDRQEVIFFHISLFEVAALNSGFLYLLQTAVIHLKYLTVIFITKIVFCLGHFCFSKEQKYLYQNEGW